MGAISADVCTLGPYFLPYEPEVKRTHAPLWKGEQEQAGGRVAKESRSSFGIRFQLNCNFYGYKGWKGTNCYTSNIWPNQYLNRLYPQDDKDDKCYCKNLMGGGTLWHHI